MLSYLYKKEYLKKTNVKSNKFGNPRQSDESDSRPLTPKKELTFQYFELLLPLAEVEECREVNGRPPHVQSTGLQSEIQMLRPKKKIIFQFTQEIDISEISLWVSHFLACSILQM
ncbi:hypothetical protein Avbf_06229 [Armadillidium vulgare]|nr:hypothetical protein Avbf_06229 [Armadillidium vulgare]